MRWSCVKCTQLKADFSQMSNGAVKRSCLFILNTLLIARGKFLIAASQRRQYVCSPLQDHHELTTGQLRVGYITHHATAIYVGFCVPCSASPFCFLRFLKIIPTNVGMTGPGFF